MAFPLSYKYTNTLKENLDAQIYHQVMQNVSSIIGKMHTKDIVLDGNKLSFKPGKLTSNWDLMAVIDEGIFELKEEKGHLKLIYEIITRKLFFYTSIISILFNLFIQFFWDGIGLSTKLEVGIGCFLWFFGMNWIITVLRHMTLFNTFNFEVNKFIPQSGTPI